jgi:phytoene dehydrogenase-like protein
MTDVVVIGGGMNGLVAAAMLARHKVGVVVVDRQPQWGGAAATAEIAPGFRVPALSHALGPISHGVVRALRLDRAGIEFLTPDPAATSLSDDGRALTFHRDEVLTSASINAFSASDAARWTDFKRTIQKVAGLVALLDGQAAPPIDAMSTRDWLRLALVGRRARGLGRRHLAQLARWLPMSVADLTGEWFESDVLRAAIAAHAIHGNPAGPRSAGTGAMFLKRVAADPIPVGSGATARGGPGAVAEALVQIATRHGATFRTGARVARILTQDGRSSGVVLDNGDVINALVVIAAIHPNTALCDLVDPAELSPTFRTRIRHIRSRGVTSKLNLALSGLPAFSALASDSVPLRGRLLVAPTLEYLERAFDATKYGAMSDEPWLEMSIPSVLDSSLAPDGAHVMSIYAHFAPRQLRSGPWAQARAQLTEAVLGVVERHAPGIRQQIVAAETLTPEDLEDRWGFSGGHIFHGEDALDQMWAARPLLGWSEHRSPIRGLYLASAGTHPGGGLTGLPGWLAARRVIEDLRKKRV